MSTEQITVADGKYQVFHERGKLWALRNGEPWSRDITGDNLIYWMMMRILELEAAQPTLANGLTEAETSATASVMGLSNPGELPGMWHESDLIGGETDCTPAQATQAEVTPEEVMRAAKEATAPEWQDVVDGWHMGLDLMKFTSLILALRPAAVPMTAEYVQAAFLSAPTSSGGHRTAFMLGIQFAEAHHGIKPKEQA